MPAKVVTMLTEKGGVGKTTMTVALAAMMAHMGKTICIIDTDTQGHIAIRLKREAEDGFYALMQDFSWRDCLRPIAPDYYGGKTQNPLLWIVPGSSATRQLDNNLNAHYLINRLGEVRETFDYIFFDTSPKLGAIHAALYAASDYILIPSECTQLSVRGVISTMNHIASAGKKAEEVGLTIGTVLGIIPTKFNGSKKVHYQNLGWLGGKYGDEMLMSPIRFLTDWEKAEALQIPIHVHNPRSAATADTRSLVRQILNATEDAHA